MAMANFARGRREGRARRVLFVSGDHTKSYAQVIRLIEDVGFASVEIGNLDTGGLLRQPGRLLDGKGLLLED